MKGNYTELKMPHTCKQPKHTVLTRDGHCGHWCPVLINLLLLWTLPSFYSQSASEKDWEDGSISFLTLSWYPTVTIKY